MNCGYYRSGQVVTLAGIIWFVVSQRKGPALVRGSAALAVGLLCVLAIRCSRRAVQARTAADGRLGVATRLAASGPAWVEANGLHGVAAGRGWAGDDPVITGQPPGLGDQLAPPALDWLHSGRYAPTTRDSRQHQVTVCHDARDPAPIFVQA